MTDLFMKQLDLAAGDLRRYSFSLPRGGQAPVENKNSSSSEEQSTFTLRGWYPAVPLLIAQQRCWRISVLHLPGRSRMYVMSEPFLSERHQWLIMKSLPVAFKNNEGEMLLHDIDKAL